MQYLSVNNWSIYPELKSLQVIPRPPKTLYIKGEFDSQLFSNCVAIVGSRRMTEYGKQVIEKLVPKLVFDGKTIVSGFMYGVDQYAHRVCVECGGKTVAVLGWGISLPLEGYDEKLAQAITDSGGLILSQWENQKATLWTFPVRNKLVAALSSEVYVIEAAIKSGSLITAELAHQYKRQVWAVPGPVTSRVSEGTNQLIAQGKAKSYIGNTHELPTKDCRNPLVDLLLNEALSANELARKLNKSIADVGAELSLMTITGQLVEREGKYYLNYAHKN